MNKESKLFSLKISCFSLYLQYKDGQSSWQFTYRQLYALKHFLNDVSTLVVRGPKPGPCQNGLQLVRSLPPAGCCCSFRFPNISSTCLAGKLKGSSFCFCIQFFMILSCLYQSSLSYVKGARQLKGQLIQLWKHVLAHMLPADQVFSRNYFEKY